MVYLCRTNLSMDLQGLLLSATSSVNVLGVSQSIARSVDVQGVGMYP
jgi:hypothetical protein